MSPGEGEKDSEFLGQLRACWRRVGCGELVGGEKGKTQALTPESRLEFKNSAPSPKPISSPPFHLGWAGVLNTAPSPSRDCPAQIKTQRGNKIPAGREPPVASPRPPQPRFPFLFFVIYLELFS